MKKTKKRIFISSIAVIFLVVFAIMFFGKKGKQELKINTVDVVQDSVEITVTATGEIQPVYKVDVGTQVSGIVEKLYVDFNTEVEKGELLAELDKSTLLEQVTQSQASLSDAESNYKFAKQAYERTKQLYENKAATQESFESATNNYIQAKNKVTTAKSNLQKATVNLSYAKIYSPISGVILNKAVEEGQTVAASFSTPTLFTIANDLTQMQVEADVDEADIGQIKVGQIVSFTVDAYPNDVFLGTVKQVRLEPTVTSNVVTYTVIIDAPNPEEKLFPGMTASVSITVDREKGFVIPMEAIYFSLDNATKKILTKKGYSFKELFASSEELANSLKDIDTKTVWIQKDKNLVQLKIGVGINDGAKTIVVKGLNKGDKVVLSVNEVVFSASENTGSNPFMPGPPRQKNR